MTKPVRIQLKRTKGWWIVALIGEVIGDDEKYGALTREIIGEAL